MRRCYDETEQQQFKLCGFLHATLVVNETCRDLMDSKCFFNGESVDLCILTEAGLNVDQRGFRCRADVSSRC